MSGVITLDGLKNASVPKSSGSCKETTDMWFDSIGGYVRVCSEDLNALSKPGKTRTRKRTQKRTPKVCTEFKTVTTKTGRKMCRCTNKGNSKLQPNAKCGLK